MSSLSLNAARPMASNLPLGRRTTWPRQPSGPVRFGQAPQPPKGPSGAHPLNGLKQGLAALFRPFKPLWDWLGSGAAFKLLILEDLLVMTGHILKFLWELLPFN